MSSGFYESDEDQKRLDGYFGKGRISPVAKSKREMGRSGSRVWSRSAVTNKGGRKEVQRGGSMHKCESCRVGLSSEKVDGLRGSVHDGTGQKHDTSGGE